MMRCLLFAGLLSAVAGAAGLGSGQALAAGHYFVQLASVKSDAGARKEWARMQRAHPDLLGDLELSVQSADLGERGIFFRIRTGPFPNKATAQDMCWQIKAAKLDCLVVRGK
jgi:cell division septation protein DedD